MNFKTLILAMTLLPLIGNPSIANEDGYWIINIWAHKDKASIPHVFGDRALVESFVLEKDGFTSGDVGTVCVMSLLAFDYKKSREYHKLKIESAINQLVKMLPEASSLITKAIRLSIAEHKNAYRNVASFTYTSHCIVSKGVKDWFKLVNKKMLFRK